MIRFFKIFFWQLLKTLLIVLGFVGGVLVSIYVASALPPNWSKVIFTIFVIASLIITFVAPFWLEHRKHLSLNSLLSESLLMLISMTIVIGSSYLGLFTGANVARELIEYDGTGLGYLFFFLIGSVAGVVTGALLAALITTVWKFWRDGKQNSPENGPDLSVN